MGEDTEDMFQTTSAMADYLKKTVNVDILDAQGNFRNLKDIVVDLGKAFEQIDDQQLKQAVAEKLAGKTQMNVLLSAISNYKQIEKAYETAATSAGSAAREQENYAMSIQYSIEKTKASLQELANDLFASNFLKSGIEVVDFIVNAVDKLSNVITGPGVIGVGLVLKQMILHFDKILKFVKDKDFANLPKRMSDLGKVISSVQKISATASNVDQLAKATENLTIKSTALILSQQGVEKSIAAKVLVTKGATEADAEAALAAAGYTVAAEGAETATVSWSAALKGLWASMAPAIAAAVPFLAIAGALGTGIIIAKNYNRAMEEIGSTARKVGDEYKEYTESIESYKEEITSLKTDLESNTLSYDEARSARERLIEIQKELIEQLKLIQQWLQRCIQLKNYYLPFFHQPYY